jgi:2-aminoethylphosphonate-pyruvate transaminase
MVIYPGKLNEVDCFRIGNIGRLFGSDIESFLTAIEATLTDMGVTISNKQTYQPLDRIKA